MRMFGKICSLSTCNTKSGHPEAQVRFLGGDYVTLFPDNIFQLRLGARVEIIVEDEEDKIEK